MLKTEVCLDWLDLVDLESPILNFSFSSLCEGLLNCRVPARRVPTGWTTYIGKSDQGTDAARLGKSVKMIRFLKVSLLIFMDRRDCSLN